MSNDQLPPPIRQSLGSTFKRPVDELFVGNLSAGFIDVTDKVPAELLNFYSTNYGGSAVFAAIRFVSINGGFTNYYYMILWNSPTAIIWSMGWVDSALDVKEGYHTELSPVDAAVFFGHVSPLRLVLGGDAGGLSELDIILSKIFVESDLNFDLTSFAGDMLINNVSMPRGLMWSKQMSGNPVGTSTAGAEIVLTTIASFTYPNGRAAEFKMHGQATMSAAGSVTYRLRRGPGIGALIASFVMPHSTAGQQEDEIWAYVLNTSGADITEQVTITMQASGALNASFFATGAGQGQALCMDIGDATKFTGASTANW